MEDKNQYLRNPDGIWINTNYFRESAINFKKHGYYNNDPINSAAWHDFWYEERRRCIEGYGFGGVKITGDHYAYLNYCPIMKTEDMNAKKSKKIRDFADFWDGDYEYFWAREIARNGVAEIFLEGDNLTLHNSLANEERYKKNVELYNLLKMESKICPEDLDGGLNMIVGKSRRKGYSFKNAAVGVVNYHCIPESLTIYSAYEKKFLFPKGIFTMVLSYVNFINDNTAWGMPRDVINRSDHIRASYKSIENGIEVEKGFKSEIIAISAKDNADVLRGKDARDVIVEEAGAFGSPGLLDDFYKATEDVVKDGEIKTGMITVFGTSGDIEGGTADYASMINNPRRYGFMAFDNIFEEKPTTRKVGFFHPVHWNLPGHIDEQGNSRREMAKVATIAERDKAIQNGASAKDINSKKQEKPLSPSEAFGALGNNFFPIEELTRQREIVIAKEWDKIKGQDVSLEIHPDTGHIIAKRDLKAKLQRIDSMSPQEGARGCVTIYEPPILDAPKELYKIGYDPVRQDKGSSNACVIVYKTVFRGSFFSHVVVAVFLGRGESNDDNHKMAEYMSRYYLNAKIMYENEVPDVKTYFTRRKMIHLLAEQPDAVISKNVKNSKVARVFGCHVNTQLKAAGERYIKQWLEEVIDFDEHGSPVTRVSHIYSLRLLDELIYYSKEEQNKFDMISTLIMCLFSVQEEEITKEHAPKNKNQKVQDLISSYKKRIGG